MIKNKKRCKKIDKQKNKEYNEATRSVFFVFLKWVRTKDWPFVGDIPNQQHVDGKNHFILI